VVLLRQQQQLLMNPAFPAFRKRIFHPLRFRLFLLQQLPAALIAGVRIHSLEEGKAVVKANYSWINKNPFRSMYFAVQSMAAEMSTGLLATGQVFRREPAVSLLVVGLEARFLKKVTGRVFFTCNDGEAIAAAVDKAITSGEPQTIGCVSRGTDASGAIVAEFVITWSFKAKQ
jgi:hypothetical protein